MSAKSGPPAYTSSGGRIIKNRTDAVMLNKYLANPPTITEKLAVQQAPKKKAQIVKDGRNEAGEFLRNWQASWDKAK